MSTLKVERGPSLTEAAISKLTEAILVGDFRPGQRLNEMDLSAKLGISRAPLREALRVLEAERLIKLKANRGAYVAQPSAEEIEEMAFFRAMVEGSAGRLLAASRNEAAFAKLERIIQELQAAHEQGDASMFLSLMWRFHAVICEDCGNSYLHRAWSILCNVMRLYHKGGVDEELVLRNNTAFLREFRKGDPARVEELLRSQILRSAYQAIAKPIPDYIASYVTLYIDERGVINPYKKSGSV